MRRGYSTLAADPCPIYNRPARIARRLLWGVLERTAKNRILTTRLTLGPKIMLRVGDQISKIVFHLGCHEPELTARLLPLVQPGATIFDIGANIGYFTVLLANRAGPQGKVHAFEINTSVIELLELNSASATHGNIEIVRKAVARKSGEVDFYVPRLGDEGEGSTRKSDRYEATARTTVPCTSLDDYVAERGIDRVDLIKIDIEGGELEAFAGASGILSSDPKPILMFEALDTACTNFGTTWLDTVTMVRDHGYRIYQGDTANFFALPA